MHIYEGPLPLQHEHPCSAHILLHLHQELGALTSCRSFSSGPPVHHPLQVDYTGFSTINPQRFGQKFVGKVANPHDMLLWQKAVVKKAKVSPAG